jgi:hypothetical protein
MLTEAYTETYDYLKVRSVPIVKLIALFLSYSSI